MIAELKHIVLAEDNANDVELTLTALRENRVINEVVVVRDGEEALDYLYKRNRYANRPGGNPALVLLDLKMPKVDGIEVLRQLRARPETRAIPVVVMTSSNEERDVVEAYRLGVNSYIVKPVAFESFRDTVSKIGLYWLLTNRTPQ
jgi:CheY-like chemotaxis protein